MTYQSSNHITGKLLRKLDTLSVGQRHTRITEAGDQLHAQPTELKVPSK